MRAEQFQFTEFVKDEISNSHIPALVFPLKSSWVFVAPMSGHLSTIGQHAFCGRLFVTAAAGDGGCEQGNCET